MFSYYITRKLSFGLGGASLLAFGAFPYIGLSPTIVGPAFLLYSLIVEKVRRRLIVEKTEQFESDSRGLETVKELIKQELSIRLPEDSIVQDELSTDKKYLISPR